MINFFINPPNSFIILGYNSVTLFNTGFRKKGFSIRIN